MGKSLSIHPLTIIVVILAAGDLGGFTLVLIAVPLYAVLKRLLVIFSNTANALLIKQTAMLKTNSVDVFNNIDTIASKVELQLLRRFLCIKKSVR